MVVLAVVHDHVLVFPYYVHRRKYVQSVVHSPLNIFEVHILTELLVQLQNLVRYLTVTKSLLRFPLSLAFLELSAKHFDSEKLVSCPFSCYSGRHLLLRYFHQTTFGLSCPIFSQCGEFLYLLVGDYFQA